MATEHLDRSPALGPELARGLLTARGRTGGSLPERSLTLGGIRVDRDHLARYQRLCGFPVSDRLPHTYPHLLSFPLQARLMAAPGFPLSLPGLVHIRNEIRAARPLGADEAYAVTVRAERLSPHAKGTNVDLLAELTAGDEPVWRSRSTYLSRGEPRAGAADPVASAAEPPARPGLPGGVPVARWRLPADLGRAYAGVSGDINPIHLHPWAARAFGFPRAVAHGMWTYARTLAALGPAVTGGVTSRVWFRKPVLLPTTVALLREGPLRTDREGSRPADAAADTTVAALVPAREPSVAHLLLTVERS